MTKPKAVKAAALATAAQPDPVEACLSCRFFFSSNLCRRFPPQNTQPDEKGGYTSNFPAMKPTGWCGEWKTARP